MENLLFNEIRNESGHKRLPNTARTPLMVTVSVSSLGQTSSTDPSSPLSAMGDRTLPAWMAKQRNQEEQVHSQVREKALLTCCCFIQAVEVFIMQFPVLI